MLKCKQMTDKGCLVVYTIAAEWQMPAAAACVACQKSDPPNDRNKVTCGLAIGVLSRSGKLSNRMASEFVMAYKPPTQNSGPGTELQKLIPSLFKFKSCNCKNYVVKMNKWGIEGCVVKFDSIVNHLVSQSKKKAVLKVFPAVLARQVAVSLVSRAIENARKNIK